MFPKISASVPKISFNVPKIPFSGLENIPLRVSLRWVAITVLVVLLIYSSVLGQANKSKCSSYILTKTDSDGIESYLRSAGFYNNDSPVTVNGVKNLISLNLKDVVRLQNLRDIDDNPSSDETQLNIDFELAPDSSSSKTGVGTLSQSDSGYYDYHTWYWKLNPS